MEISSIASYKDGIYLISFHKVSQQCQIASYRFDGSVFDLFQSVNIPEEIAKWSDQTCTHSILGGKGHT